jgi:hypothetical protein
MHMKISALAGAILALTLGAGVANAADLPAGLKDGAPSSLSGFYGEIAGGYGFSQGTVTGLAASGVSLASTGALFNLRGGYDYKFPSARFGVGVWAEGSNAVDVNGTSDGFSLGNRWSWGTGGKLFYDYGTGQVYAIGGYEGTQVTATGASTQYLDGGLWGVGINTKIAKNAYVKLEFDQIYNGAIDWKAVKAGDTAASAFSLSQVDNRVLVGIGFTVN